MRLQVLLLCAAVIAYSPLQNGLRLFLRCYMRRTQSLRLYIRVRALASYIQALIRLCTVYKLATKRLVIGVGWLLARSCTQLSSLITVGLCLQALQVSACLSSGYMLNKRKKGVQLLSPSLPLQRRTALLYSNIQSLLGLLSASLLIILLSTLLICLTLLLPCGQIGVIGIRRILYLLYYAITASLIKPLALLETILSSVLNITIISDRTFSTQIHIMLSTILETSQLVIYSIILSLSVSSPGLPVQSIAQYISGRLGINSVSVLSVRSGITINQ